MGRIVLARKVNSMIGWRWSGDEPSNLNDLDLALHFGAVWEGDELVHYDMEGLEFQLAQHEGGDYLIDND